jgi:hypothetical protein
LAGRLTPALLVILAGAALVHAQTRVPVDRPFASGGRIDMQLDGGNYTIKQAADNRIKVTIGGNAGKATASLTVAGTRATLVVKDGPQQDFNVTIDVPRAADLAIRLAAGNLTVAAIAGSKEITSTAGNVDLAVGDVSDYASLDASVKAGDIESGPFGEAKSGLFQRLTWSGKGKHTIRVNLGAGNLALYR